ncbi:MAG: hypothetical protein LBU07_03070 [Coriobacteriales bacterium]|nr:hypothetical protein [Coriobacteriales bacterium]
MRPLALISHIQPGEKWETLDFLLVRAYEALQSYKCPHCGGWLWECSSMVAKTAYVSYSVRESFCKKTRALNQFMDNKQDGKSRAKQKEKEQWGAVHSVEAVVDKVYAKDGAKMPSITDLIESQAKNPH